MTGSGNSVSRGKGGHWVELRISVLLLVGEVGVGINVMLMLSVPVNDNPDLFLAEIRSKGGQFLKRYSR